MTATLPSNIRSIQGEQQAEASYTVPRMDEASIKSYLKGKSKGVAACRSRGRHLIPTAIETDDDLIFTGVTEDGDPIQKLWCTSCHLAYRIRLWIGEKRGRKVHWHFVTSNLRYVNGLDGETYLASPGEGRMAPSDVEVAIVNQKLSGMSMTKVLKLARQAQEAIEAEENT